MHIFHSPTRPQFPSPNAQLSFGFGDRVASRSEAGRCLGVGHPFLQKSAIRSSHLTKKPREFSPRPALVSALFPSLCRLCLAALVRRRSLPSPILSQVRFEPHLNYLRESRVRRGRIKRPSSTPDARASGERQGDVNSPHRPLWGLRTSAPSGSTPAAKRRERRRRSQARDRQASVAYVGGKSHPRRARRRETDKAASNCLPSNLS
jgi:hypothetical protein